MRELDDQSLMDEYLELKGQVAEASERMDKIKPELISALWSEENHSYDHKGFTFAIQVRRSWFYSASLIKMDNELKALRKVEQANGTAEMDAAKSVLIIK